MSGADGGTHLLITSDRIRYDGRANMGTVDKRLKAEHRRIIARLNPDFPRHPGMSNGSCDTVEHQPHESTA